MSEHERSFGEWVDAQRAGASIANSITPPADTSTAGGRHDTELHKATMDIRVIDPSAGGRAHEQIYDVLERLVESRLAALREQLAREQQAAIHIAATCLLAGAKGEDGSITSAVDELAQKLTEAEAALKQMREALKQALNNERRRLQNPHSDDEPVADEHLLKYQPYRLYHDVLAIQPDSTALKTVIEAKTAKLREALEVVTGELAEDVAHQCDFHEINASKWWREVKRARAVLAASAQKAGQERKPNYP